MKIKIQILILIILPALPAFSQFSGFPDITPRPPEPATLKPDIRIGNEPSSSRGYSYPGIRHPHHTDTYDYDSEILHRRNLINRKIIEEATAHIKEAQVRKSVDSPPGMLTEDHHHTVHEERQVCYSSHLRPKSLHL